MFEKVRCEKRLLEDKYKTLKEKYIRLKTDAKSSLEKKKKKKESSTATGSETEKSSSNWANSDFEKVNNDSPNQQRKQDKEKRLRKQINQLECFYHDVSTEDEENLMSPKNLSHFQKSFGVSDSKKKQVKNEEKLIKSSSNSERKEELSGEDTKLKGSETKKKRQLFSRFKAVSTSKINCNNKNQVKVRRTDFNPNLKI